MAFSSDGPKDAYRAENCEPKTVIQQALFANTKCLCLRRILGAIRADLDSCQSRASVACYQARRVGVRCLSSLWVTALFGFATRAGRGPRGNTADALRNRPLTPVGWFVLGWRLDVGTSRFVVEEPRVRTDSIVVADVTTGAVDVFH